MSARLLHIARTCRTVTHTPARRKCLSPALVLVFDGLSQTISPSPLSHSSPSVIQIYMHAFLSSCFCAYYRLPCGVNHPVSSISTEKTIKVCIFPTGQLTNTSPPPTDSRLIVDTPIQIHKVTAGIQPANLSVMACADVALCRIIPLKLHQSHL